MRNTTSIKAILISKESFDKKAARFVFNNLLSGRAKVLALPTGITPLEMYKGLVFLTKTQNFSWQKIKIFMLDTLYSQDSHDPNSSYSYIKKTLVDHIDLPKENFHILDSQTQNPKIECQKYEEEIKRANGIDIAILGIGTNGHIAFNEPGTSADSLTHLAELTPEILVANGNIPGITQGLTMGIKTILSARKIILLAKGKEKAQAVYNAVKGPISPDCPASFLQTHLDVTFILDKDAANLFKQ